MALVPNRQLIAPFLVRPLVYNEIAGRAIDFLNFAEWPHNRGFSSASLSAGCNTTARGAIENTASQGVVLDVNNYNGRSTLTIVVRVKWRSLTTRDGVWGNWGNGGTNFNLGWSTSTDLFFYGGGASIYTDNMTSVTGDIETGKWYNFVVTYDGSRSGTDRLRLWTNGLRESPTWNGTPTSTFTTTTMRAAAGNNASDMEMECFFAFKESVSDTLAAELAIDPYIVYEPYRKLINIPASGVTIVTLSGLASTGALGTLAATGAANVQPTGVSSTPGLGTIVATGSAISALNGLQSEAGIGEVTATGAALSALNGLQSEAGIGEVTVDVGQTIVPITGISTASAVGTVTATGAANVSIPGVNAPGVAGTLTVDVGGTTVLITGASAAAALGTLAVTGAANVSIPGVNAPGAVGALSVSEGAVVSITGVSSAGAAGTLTVDVGSTTVAISGVESSSAAGVLTVTGEALLTVFGVFSNGEIGALSINTTTVTVSEDRIYVIAAQDRTYTIN